MVALKEWRTPEHLVPYIDWPMLNTRFSHTAPLSIKKDDHFTSKKSSRQKICEDDTSVFDFERTHFDCTIFLIEYEQCGQQKYQGHL